jgi:hypothetical protein
MIFCNLPVYEHSCEQVTEQDIFHFFTGLEVIGIFICKVTDLHVSQ